MSQSNWTQLIKDLRNVDDIDLAIKACETISAVADEMDISKLYSLLDDDDFSFEKRRQSPLLGLKV